MADSPAAQVIPHPAPPCLPSVGVAARAVANRNGGVQACSALIRAHRALAARLMAALAAGLMVNFFFLAGAAGLAALSLAQRAF